MKKLNYAGIALCVILGIFAGCASAPSDDTRTSNVSGGKKSVGKILVTGGNQFADAPEWFNDPGVFYKEYGMDVLIGLGTSKKVNQELAVRAAEAGALRSISEQISVSVSSMFKEFLEEKGYNPDRTLEHTQSVTKTIAAETIRGGRPIKRYMSSSGRVYIATIVDQKAALRNTIEASRGALRADELYAEFQSTKAFDEMDSQLNKLKIESIPAIEG